MAINEGNYEADNLTGRNHEGPTANVPVRRLTATSIIGDTIENPEGEELGKINNLMINLFNGSVEYIVLEYGSFLGMGGKYFAIPFKELMIDPVREIFVVNRDKNYLKNAPGFEKDHWPDTNDHDGYYVNVKNYWETGPIASPPPDSPLSAYY